MATQAIVHEEVQIAIKMGTRNRPLAVPWTKQVIMPVIVTSARLFTCEFDPGHVDPASGEIPYAKATLTEQSSLIYEYPLPRHLQVTPLDVGAAAARGELEQFMKMHILVVHSEGFRSFLDFLASPNTGFFKEPNATSQLGDSINGNHVEIVGL